jgi:hypothetical protein
MAAPISDQDVTTESEPRPTDGEGPSGGVGAGRWFAVAVLVALAICTAAGLVAPAAAGVTVGVLFVGVLVRVIPPEDLRDLLHRLRRAGWGKTSIEFDRFSEKLDTVVGREEEAGVDTDGRDSHDLIELRFLLEAKLSYIAKFLLAEPLTSPRRDPDQERTPSFATIGSLQYDRYLPEAEARVAVELLTLRDGDLRGQPKAKIDDLVRRTESFVQSFRLIVFYGLVRVTIRQTPNYSCLIDSDSTRRRPDLIAEERSSGNQLLVVPVFAVPGSPASTARTVARLEDHRDEQPRVLRRLIVVPNLSEEPEHFDSDGDIRVIRIESLRGALIAAAAERAPDHGEPQSPSTAERQTRDEHEEEEAESGPGG